MEYRAKGAAGWMGVTHVFDREKGTYPFPAMCVSPFNHPYTLSFSSMLRVVPIQPAVSFLWLNGDHTHKHVLQREGFRVNGGCTHTWQKGWDAQPPFCHLWVYVIHQPYPLSLPSMFCVMPIQPAEPLIWLNEGHRHTHTQNMGDKQKVAIGWLRVAHVYGWEKGIYPSLCHPYVWAPIHQPYPLSLPSMLCVAPVQPAIPPFWLNVGLTHKIWMRGKSMDGWMGLHNSMTEIWVHTPSLCHPCCVWNPFNQPNPSSGWMTATQTHTIWMAERKEQLAEWGTYACMTENTICTLHFLIHVLSILCVTWRPINQLYLSSCWMTATHTHTQYWMAERMVQLAEQGSHTCMRERERHTPFLSDPCVCPIWPAIPLVSFIHALCGAHSTFHTPPLVNQGTHTKTERMMRLAESGSHTWMTEMRLHTPSFCHPSVCPHSTIHTLCLFHLCCMWCPFNQLYPSSGWMGTTHINMDYREKG